MVGGGKIPLIRLTFVRHLPHQGEGKIGTILTALLILLADHIRPDNPSFIITSSLGG